MICEPMSNAELSCDTLLTEISSHVRNLSLDVSTHKYWQGWKGSVRKLRFQVPKSGYALIIPVKATCEDSREYMLRALVDTGAAIPLVFKSGVLPSEKLMKSTYPVKFLTASGAVMSGGTSGCKLELSFAVAIPGTEDCERVHCESVWAYEAELHSCDLIIGYPFLSGFGLGVDARANTLIFTPSEPKACQEAEMSGLLLKKSSRVPEDFVEMRVHHLCGSTPEDTKGFEVFSQKRLPMISW